MKCIGGSVDIQTVGSKKWRRRKLWIDSGVDSSHESPEFIVYLIIRNGVNFLRSDGTIGGQNNNYYWRHIKLPEGFELHEFAHGRIIHVKDIVLATKQRLGVE